MGETVNIGALAELISSELFEEFKWKKVGPTNENWNCVKCVKHGSNASPKKQHPSDVVFYYNDPYSTKTVYVNCDLKSYAKGSISKASLRQALLSLINAVECAKISSSWKDLYLIPETKYTIVGLLFVYNHDGEYDKNFAKELNLIADLKIPKNVNIFVFSPKIIVYLHSIAYDICSLRGKDLIASKDECSFIYFDKQISKLSPNDSGKYAATIETLLGPWMIYQSKNDNFLIYYLDSGDSFQEFIYLIEYLFLYQLIKEDYNLEIRAVNSSDLASSYFSKAIKYYCENYQTDSLLEKRLRKIKFNKVNIIKSGISSMDIGMGTRG